jgi:cyclopropane-fatty-acyl-phospholipid synthase
MKSEKTMRPLKSLKSSATPTPLEKFARSVLFKKLKLISKGRIEFAEDFGQSIETHSFGQETKGAALIARVKILTPKAYPRIVLGGTIGAGESYMEGEWESDQITEVVQIFACNHELHSNLDAGVGALLAPLQKLYHRLRPNSIEGARKNIHAHYDIGNDFFELFLDESFMYSSAIFADEETTLEDAQVAKLDRICKKLELSPEDHVVEIGTGWGSFAIHAAKYYGCKVTTTTISKEQFELAKARIAEAGVSDRIELLFKDYRLLTGQYDKLVSIEMIEAVGLENLDEYFAKCSSLLKPNGQMLLQAITIRDQQYESAKRGVDFIQRYIFPGSGIPSVQAILSATGAKTNLQMGHLEDFGPHYARTLHEWSRRLKTNHQKVLQRGYTETLYRMWQYYFAYCAGGFLERNIGVSQILFLKPDARKQPIFGNLKIEEQV